MAALVEIARFTGYALGLVCIKFVTVTEFALALYNFVAWGAEVADRGQGVIVLRLALLDDTVLLIGQIARLAFCAHFGILKTSGLGKFSA